MTQVILFDVDGTLLSSRGGGKKAMEQAALELFGIENALRGVKMHGNTDPLIFREILRRAGRVDDEDALKTLTASYLDVVSGYFKEYGVIPIGGVEQGLTSLKEAGFVMGLVTGNMEETAWMKITAAGLERFFEPGLGGFGSTSGDRRHILASALREVTSRFPDVSGVFLVGDTPFDTAAAESGGIPVCAVTTGPYGAAELLSYGADAVVPSLELLTVELAKSLIYVSKTPSDESWERLHESLG